MWTPYVVCIIAANANRGICIKTIARWTCPDSLPADTGDQVFACFLDLAKPPRRESPFQDVLGMIDLFEAQTKQYADRVRYAGSWREYEANRKEGRLSAFLSLEEGGVLEGELSRLDILYQRGIRILNLTWNHENCMGYPHRPPQFQTKGLTAVRLGGAG